MPKRTTNSPTGRAVTTVMLLAALGVGVFAAYVKLNPNASRVPDEIRRPPVEAPQAAPSSSASHRRPGPQISVKHEDGATYRLPALKGEDVVLGKSVGTIPAGQQPVVFLANGALSELKIDARALGVQIKDRNALVDFNEALDKGYGSTEEGQLIKALQIALGQIKEIDTFQIVIGGQVKDTLGQLDLTEPMTVIRPDGKEAKPSATPSEGQ